MKSTMNLLKKLNFIAKEDNFYITAYNMINGTKIRLDINKVSKEVELNNKNIGKFINQKELAILIKDIKENTNEWLGIK